MKRLDLVSVGEKAKIVRIYGEGHLKRRILEMGLTPSSVVFVRKRAPLGDPMEITIRGYALTLRIDEAKQIEVKEEENV